MIELKNKFNDAVVIKTPLKHEWVTHLEHYLNTAAGWDKTDYKSFERVVFIAWPGNPKNSADYMEAVYHSKEYGLPVAKLIEQIKDFSNDMQVNLIAHSQGNGVMIKALDYLGEFFDTPLVDKAFFWQAAIPCDALLPKGITKAISPAEIENKRNQKRWFMPYAHKAAKHITVLFSQNDNIVGRVIPESQQPEGVKEIDVFQRKPFNELIFGLITTELGLHSLYEVANWIGTPISHLFDEALLDKAWLTFRKEHLYCQIDKEGFLYKETLEEQKQFYAKLESIKDFETDVIERLEKALPAIYHRLDKSYPQFKELELGAFIASVGVVVYGVVFSEFIVPFLNLVKKANSAANQAIKGYYRYYQSLFDKLLTFFHAVITNAHYQPTPGMGWQGVTKETQDFYGERLQNINTTRWVWHHSDMKVPSEDIKKHIYDERIINAPGLKFGTYPNTGKGMP